MPRSQDSTGLDTRSGAWDRLAELAQAGSAAGWNLIAGQVFDGVLTFAAAQAMFTRLQHLVDAADWADLPSVFTREGLAEAPQPLSVRVQQYLDAHAGRKVSLYDVSRAVGASVRQTAREFHRRHGLSVCAYLARQRVAHAARLLVETDLKVEAIARLAGFGHKTSLYRQFSRLLGATPGSIRRRRADAVIVKALDSLPTK